MTGRPVVIRRFRCSRRVLAVKGLWAITIILQHSRRALVPPDLCPVDSVDSVST